MYNVGLWVTLNEPFTWCDVRLSFRVMCKQPASWSSQFTTKPRAPETTQPCMWPGMLSHVRLLTVCMLPWKQSRYFSGVVLICVLSFRRQRFKNQNRFKTYISSRIKSPDLDQGPVLRHIIMYFKIMSNVPMFYLIFKLYSVLYIQYLYTYLHYALFTCTLFDFRLQLNQFYIPC